MKPLVSYLLFAYNHEHFIEAALQSAFDQDYDPLEIIVTDDSSTDATANIIGQVIRSYRGKKNVVFNNNGVNKGLIGSMNAAVSAASGSIIVMAAGDDISLPQRTSRLVGAFKENAGAQCAYSNATVINEEEKVVGPHYREAPPLSCGNRKEKVLKFEATSTSLLGATAAYRKEVFTAFGPLPTEAYYEDRLLSLRAAILGQIVYINDPLILYRQHGANLWHGKLDRISDPFERHRYELERKVRQVPVLLACAEQAEVGSRITPDLSRELAQVRTRMLAIAERTGVELRIFEATNPLKKVLIALKFIWSGRVLQGRRQIWDFAKKNLFPERYFAPIVARSNARFAELFDVTATSQKAD